MKTDSSLGSHKEKDQRTKEQIIETLEQFPCTHEDEQTATVYLW